jgi:hypothetical protein
VKHRDLAGGWIYLKLNAPEKTIAYAASASGTAPDSDIFYARTISEKMAADLAKMPGSAAVLEEQGKQ